MTDYYSSRRSGPANGSSSASTSTGESFKCGDCSNVGDFMYKWRWPFIGLVSVGALLLLILLPLSFSYVEPGEVGLPEGRVSGNVDENGRVYKMDLDTNGRYFTGVSTTIQPFNARIQQEILNLDVIASNSRGFRLEVLVTYRINQDELGQLFSKFTQNWQTPAKNEAIATIKGVTPRFSIDEYVTELETIRQEIVAELATELRLNHLSIVELGLVILRVDFSGDIDLQYLLNVVQVQNNERQLIQREVDIIVQDTETQRRAIDANRTLTIATGAAQATQIVETAQAEADRIKAVAKTTGFTNLFNHFNVTDSVLKTRFLEWFAKDNNIDKITILDGVSNAIVNLGA